jgi:hypothetical protein
VVKGERAARVRENQQGSEGRADSRWGSVLILGRWDSEVVGRYGRMGDVGCGAARMVVDDPVGWMTAGGNRGDGR